MHQPQLPVVKKLDYFIFNHSLINLHLDPEEELDCINLTFLCL